MRAGAETGLQDVTSRADMTTPGVNSIMIVFGDDMIDVYRHGLPMYSLYTLLSPDTWKHKADTGFYDLCL